LTTGWKTRCDNAKLEGEEEEEEEKTIPESMIRKGRENKFRRLLFSAVFWS
jgi:hypothetical protein